ncbi:MAG: Hsp20/alpha crystallin family protein [Planctomycetes bacterium]|nr:Hsp20/alpha crystallin family protein [Planctomycetota bacterium]
MAVFRWGQAWDPLRDLEREVDRLLASVSLSFQGVRFGRQYPPVNVYEVDDELLLTAELPGTRPEDLEVLVADGVLTIKGKRNGPVGVADDHYRRQERPRGNWQRSLTLPALIQEDKLSAEFTNGILKVRLPKAPTTTPRQIPVSDGSESV